MSQPNFSVKPVLAKLNSKRWLLMRLSPYCVVSCAGAKQQTRTARKAGDVPAWAEQFAFAARPTDMLRVEVRDAHWSKRGKLIGEASLPLYALFQTGTQRMTVTLKKDGREKGSVLLDMALVGAQPLPSPQPVYVPQPAPVYYTQPTTQYYHAVPMGTYTTVTAPAQAGQSPFYPLGGGVMPNTVTTRTSRVYSYTPPPNR